MKVRSGENRFRPHWLGALRGGSRGAHNSGKMFSIVHLEYFFGFGMFILGMTKVRPRPVPSFASPRLQKVSHSTTTLQVSGELIPVMHREFERDYNRWAEGKMAFLHLTGDQLMNAVGYIEGVVACLVMMAQPGNPVRRWGLFLVFNTLITTFLLHVFDKDGREMPNLIMASVCIFIIANEPKYPLGVPPTMVKTRRVKDPVKKDK